MGQGGQAVSDTPRVDSDNRSYPRPEYAEEIIFEGSRHVVISPEAYEELYEIALLLERELNAANSKIELLLSANADVARIADERDAAENRIGLLIAERDTARLRASQNWKIREEFRELLGTNDVAEAVAVVREMKQRIKRLEEAGDAHMEWVPVSFQSAWRKAKEAKP
jgi:hypothetical protein